MYLCEPESVYNDTALTEIIFSYSQVQFWWQEYVFLVWKIKVMQLDINSYANYLLFAIHGILYPAQWNNDTSSKGLKKPQFLLKITK